MAVTATIVPGTVTTDGTTVWGSVRVDGDSTYSPGAPDGQPQPPAVPIAVEYLASTPRKNDDGTDKTNAQIRLGLFASARLARRAEKQLLVPKTTLGITGTGDIE